MDTDPDTLLDRTVELHVSLLACVRVLCDAEELDLEHTKGVKILSCGQDHLVLQVLNTGTNFGLSFA